jgi:hypothetical protein
MKTDQEQGRVKKRGRGWLAALALLGGAAGTWLMLRPKVAAARGAGRRGGRAGDVWARPGMGVVFRAELMPGRNRAERTFRVARLHPSGRVTLEGFAGEHAEGEFEPLRFD